MNETQLLRAARVRKRGRNSTKAEQTGPELKRWTDDIDPATIPDEVLMTESGRRNALKRKSYTVGIPWAKHNSKVPGCRCKKCCSKREKKAGVRPIR
jgi:hypothetical protein